MIKTDHLKHKEEWLDPNSYRYYYFYETDMAHISHVLWHFTYTYENEIGRQLMFEGMEPFAVTMIVYVSSIKEETRTQKSTESTNLCRPKFFGKTITR